MYPAYLYKLSVNVENIELAKELDKLRVIISDFRPTTFI